MIRQNLASSSYFVNSINKINVQKTVFSLIGFIFTILTIDPYAANGYQLQFLLPLLYTILYYFFAPPIKRLGIGYLLLNSIWLIRYCIGPFFIKLSNYAIRYYSDVSEYHLYIALVLMIVELSISIISSGYFFKRKAIRVNIKERNDCINNISFKTVLILILISVVVIVFDRNALYSFNFILREQFTRKGDTAFGTSILILSWCKMVLTVYLLGKMGEKNQKNKIYLLFALFITILSISIFKETSRVILLIEALGYIFLLVRLFPKYKKQIYIINFCALFLIILTITLYRFYATRILLETFVIFDVDTISHLFNVYFAGQQNVAIGVKSLELFWQDYTLFTFLKDLFANTVVLNKFVVGIPGTVEYYNYTVYGHNLWADQIPPLITQAIALFNALGFFVPIMVIYFIIKMDIHSKTLSSTFGIFISALIASNLAFFAPGNITILSTSLNNRFIPLFIIYKLSKTKKKTKLNN